MMKQLAKSFINNKLITNKNIINTRQINNLKLFSDNIQSLTNFTSYSIKQRQQQFLEQLPAYKITQKEQEEEKLKKQKENNNFIPGQLPTFKKFDYINEKIHEYLEDKQIYTPSPIQDLVIPEIKFNSKKVNNFFFAAQTGTGKTLAYLIPIINQLKAEESYFKGEQLTRPNRPRAVILVPSKELAVQVADVCKDISHFAKLKVLSLSNASKYKFEKNALNDGVDIVVSTPDRLERHREKQNLYLSMVSYIVVDECDTFLDSGFKEKVEEYISLIKARQQNLNVNQSVPKSIFVSATITQSIQNLLGQQFADNEIKYIVEKSTHMNLHNINHEFIHCTTLDKKDPFLKLLAEIKPQVEHKNQEKRGGALIFCNSIPSCQSLQYFMNQNGYSAVSLHGEVPKKLRIQNVNRFKSQLESYMICTDLGSRGLDFSFLSHVINFDFPKTTSDYLHRAGRTGRAGRKGTVMSLYHNKDLGIIKELQKSHENNTPLKIQGSQYSKINKDILKRVKQQEIAGEGKYKEIKQQIRQQNAPKQLEQQNMKYFGRNKHLATIIKDNRELIPEEVRKFQSQWLKSKEARKELQNYIPQKNKFKDELYELKKQEKRIKKHTKMKLGKRTTKVNNRIRYLQRMVQGEKDKDQRRIKKDNKIIKKYRSKRKALGLE